VKIFSRLAIDHEADRGEDQATPRSPDQFLSKILLQHTIPDTSRLIYLALFGMKLYATHSYLANLPLGEFFRILADVSRQTAPKVRIPYTVA
jgi:hypothetical protein